MKKLVSLLLCITVLLSLFAIPAVGVGAETGNLLLDRPLMTNADMPLHDPAGIPKPEDLKVFTDGNPETKHSSFNLACSKIILYYDLGECKWFDQVVFTAENLAFLTENSKDTLKIEYRTSTPASQWASVIGQKTTAENVISFDQTWGRWIRFTIDSPGEGDGRGYQRTIQEIELYSKKGTPQSFLLHKNAVIDGLGPKPVHAATDGDLVGTGISVDNKDTVNTLPFSLTYDMGELQTLDRMIIRANVKLENHITGIYLSEDDTFADVSAVVPLEEIKSTVYDVKFTPTQAQYIKIEFEWPANVPNYQYLYEIEAYNTSVVPPEPAEDTFALEKSENNVTVTLSKLELGNGSYNLFVAFYAGDKLTDVDVTPVTVSDGSVNETVSVAIPAGATAAKAFFWDGDMKPVGDTVPEAKLSE